MTEPLQKVQELRLDAKALEATAACLPLGETGEPVAFIVEQLRDDGSNSGQFRQVYEAPVPDFFRTENWGEGKPMWKLTQLYAAPIDRPGADRAGWRVIADDPPPTNGNPFLCGWWNADRTYWWTCKAHWANGAIDGGWDGAREPIEVHPTHWRPLPAPPLPGGQP